MKAQIHNYKAYLPRYLLFILLFLLCLALLVLLKNFLVREETPVQATQSPPPVVIIDAGHGGEDCGAVGRDGVTLEKDLNLDIAKTLEALLRANGVRCVMTRSEDVLLYDKSSDYHGQKKVQDLATRLRIAEEYDNALFVSIHMNSFPQSQYSGLQVYYSKNNASSQQLAQSVQELTHTYLQKENNRKIKEAGENIFLLDRLSCPAVLVECGFLSNAEECERLSDETYRQQLALLISLAILENLSPSLP